jgi:hypothetical protein
VHDPYDAYDPHHPEFAGEGGQKLPGGGRMFGRLWFGAGGCPRAELFVVLRDGTQRKFRGQLHEVETNDDD